MPSVLKNVLASSINARALNVDIVESGPRELRDIVGIPLCRAMVLTDRSICCALSPAPRPEQPRSELQIVRPVSAPEKLRAAHGPYRRLHNETQLLMITSTLLVWQRNMLSICLKKFSDIRDARAFLVLRARESISSVMSSPYALPVALHAWRRAAHRYRLRYQSSTVSAEFQLRERRSDRSPGMQERLLQEGLMSAIHRRAGT